MSRRFGSDSGASVVDLCGREVGQIASTRFARRRGAALDLVLRLEMYMKLDGHRGCVNTISFNGDGGVLVSGSDDKTVKIWDWESGHMNLSFHSGHASNVFQAKFMPFSDDRSIVTCAADGQVRHARVLERGEVETILLSRHEGRTHALAIEPGSPNIFYTCGDDGLVQHFDLRAAAARQLFTCHGRDATSYVSVIHLNAIAIDPRNHNLVAVAGSDEYARVYDIRKYKLGLAFSDQSELLVSYNDEAIYLFPKDTGLGSEGVLSSQLSVGDDDGPMSMDMDLSSATTSLMDTDEQPTSRRYAGHRNCETLKGVNFLGPGCEYVVSGSDCGNIFIWKKRSGELIRVMEADNNVVNCLQSHPHSLVLASSGIDREVKIWTPKAIESATLPVKINRRHTARGCIHPLASPRDLWAQLLSTRETSRTSAEERRTSNPVLAQELVDLVLTFDVTSDGSESDDGTDANAR
uniref:Uncharacterized protein n=1 Tax=Kalanchoe fedtschenkoi TaxID=63787 RepID=A0A7N0UWD7_KALFE